MAAEAGERRRLIGEAFLAERTRLVRTVRRKLFDISIGEAEDLVSDVFYNIIRRGDFVSQIENLTAYLYRSLANRIADRRRAPVRERSIEDVNTAGDDLLRRALEPVSDDSTPEQALQQKQLREQIRRALERLKPQDRAVWIETEIEGRGFKELSEEWKVPMGTLLSRKSRAGKTLRMLLGAQRSL